MTATASPGHTGFNQVLFRGAGAALVRVCAYPVELCDAAHAADLQAALSAFPDFAEALRRSSQSLSSAIDRDQRKPQLLPDWENAAWRYLLRATQMPIPYGLLVGTGTVPFSSQFNRIDASAHFITQSIPEVRQDWVWLLERAHADRHSYFWTLHPALYRLADGVRYLHVGRMDEVRVLHGSEEILDAVTTQTGMFSLAMFEAHLVSAAKLSRIEARNLANGLVEQGFLVPSTTKSQTEGLAEGAAAVAKVLAHRSISLPWTCAERVENAVSFLAKVLAPPPDSLRGLKQAFSDRWQDQRVSLMVMFDPDVGIDMDGRQSRQLGELLRGCELMTSEPGAQEPVRTDFGWTAKDLEGMKVLNLSDLGIPEDMFLDAKLPSSLAAIFQIDGVEGDSVWLQTAAGEGAARLLSRAALQDPDAAALLAEVAQWDKHRKSAVHAELFVAPTIQDAPTVGRVNPFEAVLATCGAPTDNAVPLSAVEVQLCEDEFRLFDSRTGSTLEVHHSDPLRIDAPGRAPHLRFLARMAARPAFWSLRWKWLPHEEAAHLPRVVYKGVVLHPESWRLQWSEVRNLTYASVRQLLLSRAVPEMTLAKPEEHPAQVISLRHNGSIQDLVRILRRVKVVYLQECCPNGVLELGAARHVCEFVLPLQRVGSTPDGIRTPYLLPTASAESPPVKAAGAMSGWLSFEIGTYESRADLLILDIILPLVRQLIDNGTVMQWHYTRGDTAEGAIVTLRVRVGNEADEVTSIVQEYVRANGRRLVRGCRATLFLGETNRYGGAQDYCEVLRHFEIQSWDCVAWLDTSPLPDERARVLRQALVCASTFRVACASNTALEACTLLASRIRPEWIAPSAARKIASDLFRTHRDFLLEKFDDRAAFANVSTASTTMLFRDRSKVDVLFSTLHMYGNRLFRHAQRDHEHIAYLLAAKLLVSHDMRARTRANCKRSSGPTSRV